MTGYEVLAFFGAIARSRLHRTSEPSGQATRSPTRARTTAMSTGMRQKLGLVAVLAVDAPTIILDEPTSNLDPTVRKEVAALVCEAQTAGQTVVFSSHVLEEVERLCDRVAILRRGKLVHEQLLNTLRRQHRIRAEFAVRCRKFQLNWQRVCRLKSLATMLDDRYRRRVIAVAGLVGNAAVGRRAHRTVGLARIRAVSRRDCPRTARARRNGQMSRSNDRQVAVPVEFPVSRRAVGESPQRSAAPVGSRR